MCEDACFLCRMCDNMERAGDHKGEAKRRAPLRRKGGRAMDLPKRKQIRLPDYDYSAPGAYFVTICTRDRRCILSDVTVGAAISRPPELHLTAYGEIVDSAIKSIPAIYPAVFIDNYVIMPNHVHLILRINTDNDGRQIAAPTLISVIGQMKRWASMRAGSALWQKSYHEHVIRNKKDYQEIWEYIVNNPARWVKDRYYIEGEHSTEEKSID